MQERAISGGTVVGLLFGRLSEQSCNVKHSIVKCR